MTVSQKRLLDMKRRLVGLRRDDKEAFYAVMKEYARSGPKVLVGIRPEVRAKAKGEKITDEVLASLLAHWLHAKPIMTREQFCKMAWEFGFEFAGHGWPSASSIERQLKGLPARVKREPAFRGLFEAEQRKIEENVKRYEAEIRELHAEAMQAEAEARVTGSQ